MSSTLKLKIDHYFSVFKDNVEEDLHQLLPPTPEAKKFQSSFEDNLEEFRAVLLNHLRENGLI